MPAIGDALQFVLARIFEPEPGARDQIFDGGGHEHL
jgi:hypothetical protein